MYKVAITTKVSKEKDQNVEKDEKEAPVQQGQIMVAGLPRVKHTIRWISKTGRTSPDEGYWNVAEIDAYIASIMDQGYDLKNTHYLGDNTDGYGVLYIFVRND